MNKNTIVTNPKKLRKLKVKKKKDIKSVEERNDIVKEIQDKLIEVHLASVDDDGKVYSGFEGVEELLKILQEYVKPTILSGFSGVIKLPELSRNIEYILPLQTVAGHGVRLVSVDKKEYVV